LVRERVKDKNVALKLDISKEYDRIDWLCLKEVMLKMGFDRKWVQWIMMCVETVDYSVIVNNELVGPIIPGREGLDKVTRCHLIYLFCVLKAYPPLSGKQNEVKTSMACLFVLMHLLFLTYCLQMTAFCFSGLMIMRRK
jgi:hypothetical protein